jgi:endonuclease/exonuclease/phosphatase family metal-dependent hydrolase
MLLFLCSAVQAQDTIRVMQYNLFRYGETGKEPALKNPLLKTIVDHVQPDIIGTNEISGSADYASNIVNGCLNTNGETKWAKSTLSKAGADQSLTNSLFYDKNKFKILKQDTVSTVQREITGFRMLYLDSNLSITKDSIFFTILVLHFKAGNTSSDASIRANEALQIKNYLDALPRQSNVMVMGDFNIYTSTEAAYQNMVTAPNIRNRMFDPINRPGTWNNSATFKDIHTQSTHTTQTGGFSSGGMDDRFDVLICSSALMGDSLKMRVLPNTYTAVGNDGQRFNMAINDPPTNTSVPSSVLGALYAMSDHIPISVDFVLSPDKPVVQGLPQKKRELENSFYISNPVKDDLHIYLKPLWLGESIKLKIMNAQGAVIYQSSTVVAEQEIIIAGNEIASQGIFFVMIENKDGWKSFRKIVR